jgi:hypothetical protein
VKTKKQELSLKKPFTVSPNRICFNKVRSLRGLIQSSWLYIKLESRHNQGESSAYPKKLILGANRQD